MISAVVTAAHQPRSRLLVRQIGPGREPWPDAPRTYALVELYFDGAQWSRAATDSHADVMVLDRDRGTRRSRIVKELWQRRRELFDGAQTIAMSEDDAEPHGCTWDDVFALFEEVAARERCGIGQPALTRDSFWGHEITRQIRGCRYRVTDFCENMVPVFTRAAWERHVESFDMTALGNGLDVVWSEREGRCLVLDSTPFVHDRPLGGSYDRWAMELDSRALYRRLGILPDGWRERRTLKRVWTEAA